MLRLVSLICLFLIALLRLVGGATNTQIIQIHDDLFFDSRADVPQEALNTGCEGTFISDLGARKQNTPLAVHLRREALSASRCSQLAIVRAEELTQRESMSRGPRTGRMSGISFAGGIDRYGAAANGHRHVA